MDVDVEVDMDLEGFFGAPSTSFKQPTSHDCLRYTDEKASLSLHETGSRINSAVRYRPPRP